MRPWFFQWGTIFRPRSVRLREFFAALPQDRPYCIQCLAQLSSASEPEVRRELQVLARRLEASVARCGTCEEARITYRLVG